MENDVTGEIKTSLLTTSGKLLLVSVLAGPFLVIALLWLANNVLPAGDAEAFKKPILAGWAAIMSASGIGTVAASLLSRWGKVSTQKEIAVEQTKATIATETAAVAQVNAVTNTERVDSEPEQPAVFADDIGIPIDREWPAEGVPSL